MRIWSVHRLVAIWISPRFTLTKAVRYQFANTRQMKGLTGLIRIQRKGVASGALTADAFSPFNFCYFGGSVDSMRPKNVKNRLGRGLDVYLRPKHLRQYLTHKLSSLGRMLRLTPSALFDRPQHPAGPAV